jgi:hypothetical protein
MDEENAECPNATLTMRSATVSRVLVGYVNADANVPTTRFASCRGLIAPRHVVRYRGFDATSFASRQRGGRWFEPTAALRTVSKLGNLEDWESASEALEVTAVSRICGTQGIQKDTKGHDDLGD